MNGISLGFVHFSTVIVKSGKLVSRFALRFVCVTLNLNKSLEFQGTQVTKATEAVSDAGQMRCNGKW